MRCYEIPLRYYGTCGFVQSALAQRVSLYAMVEEAQTTKPNHSRTWTGLDGFGLTLCAYCYFIIANMFSNDSDFSEVRVKALATALATPGRNAMPYPSGRPGWWHKGTLAGEGNIHAGGQDWIVSRWVGGFICLEARVVSFRMFRTAGFVRGEIWTPQSQPGRTWQRTLHTMVMEMCSHVSSKCGAVNGPINRKWCVISNRFREYFTGQQLKHWTWFFWTCAIIW